MKKLKGNKFTSRGIENRSKMDSIKVKRAKKSDKSKEKYERNGGFSQKHVRLVEARAEKSGSKSETTKK